MGFYLKRCDTCNKEFKRKVKREDHFRTKVHQKNVEIEKETSWNLISKILFFQCKNCKKKINLNKLYRKLEDIDYIIDDETNESFAFLPILL